MKNRMGSHGCAAFFFLALLAIGLSLYDDYGLSWDEQTNRTNGAITALYINAKLGHAFVSKEAVGRLHEQVRDRRLAYQGDAGEFHRGKFTYDGKSLQDYTDKDYGVVFELFLIGLEWVLRLTETRDVYLTRHLATFFTFYVGVFFFYLLVRRRFRDWKIGILACILLLTNPRVLAHSFYNSKDVPFLALYIISSYSLVVFLEKKDFKTGVCHAIATAILVDIRIGGVIVPVLTCLFFMTEMLKREKKESLRKLTAVLGSHLAVLLGFVVFFWPHLWEHPVTGFVDALANMSHFRWQGEVLFMGSYYLARDLPRYYLLLWILVTIPILYMVGFASGVSGIVVRWIRNWKNGSIQGIAETAERRMDHVMLLLGMGPLFGVILLGSPVYDGWRQLFFVYPSMVYVSMLGLSWLWEFAERGSTFLGGHRLVKVGAATLCLAGVASPISFMVRHHPFENVYFNYLAGSRVEKDFERDYWGLSYRQALEHILETDKDSLVKVAVANFPGELNSQIIGNEARRLKYVPLEEADYFVTNYRPKNSPISDTSEEWKKIFSIDIEGFSIVGVYARKGALEQKNTGTKPGCCDSRPES
jgi:hypothetical protein